MGGVFDYSQVVLRSDLQDGIAVARMTVEMYRHNGLHTQAKTLFGGLDLMSNAVGIQIQRAGFDIVEDGRGAYVLDDVHSRTECKRSGDDSIARANTKRQKRKVQRGGARTHGQGIRSMDEAREVLFKVRHFRSGGNPLGAQSIDDFVDFLFSDQWRREWQEFIAQGGDDLYLPHLIDIRLVRR